MSTSALFVEIVTKLNDDPILDASDAFVGLLVTQSHIVIRFRRYSLYPTAYWALCKALNPMGYASACRGFLHADQRDLYIFKGIMGDFYGFGACRGARVRPEVRRGALF